MSAVTEPSKANVDQAEIKKFADLASRWWDTESEFKPLHDINPLRLEYIQSLAGNLTGKKILDVGCGGGILSDAMAGKGAIVTGIDMGEAPLSVARLHQLESGQKVTYLQSTVEDMALKHPQAFDVITCMEMMEHVPDPSSVIRACAKLVKPDGALFFSTINRTPKAFALAIVGAEYLLKMLPKGTHEYQKFIKPHEMARWSRNANLEIQDLIGMHYNPLTKTYKLAPGSDVNYLAYLTPSC